MSNQKSNGHRPADGNRPASKGAPHPLQKDMGGAGNRPMERQGEHSDTRKQMRGYAGSDAA